MVKLNYPGSVVHVAPFSWGIYAAPAGATWTATVTRNGAPFGDYSGVIPASGVAKASQSTLIEGEYDFAFTFSTGEYIRFPVVSHARMTFHWAADFGAKLNKAPVLRPIKFGDGYEQSVPNGLNHNPATWGISLTELDDMTACQIMLFLDNLGGHKPFWWTDPDGIARQFKCSEYERTYNDGDNNSVNATFKQYFG